MEATTDKLGDWRTRLAKVQTTAERLERFARERALPSGFEVRENWPGLDWCEWGSSHKDGQSLPRFRAMVAQVVAFIGPADSVNAESWVGERENEAPDLVAKWNVDGVTVTVRVLWPVGCKVDPRAPGKKSETAKLHPECVAALAEIADLATAAT